MTKTLQITKDLTIFQNKIDKVKILKIALKSIQKLEILFYLIAEHFMEIHYQYKTLLE